VELEFSNVAEMLGQTKMGPREMAAQFSVNNARSLPLQVQPPLSAG